MTMPRPQHTRSVPRRGLTLPGWPTLLVLAGIGAVGTGILYVLRPEVIRGA